MTDVKHRVKFAIGGKSYDLRPSGNPHAKLSKDVIKFLNEGGHLADSVAAPAAAGSSDLARMQAEIEKLTGELSTVNAELTGVKAELTKSDTDLSAALAEIEKLKPEAK